jgi:methanogenic corrinoid protein MtbC1
MTDRQNTRPAGRQAMEAAEIARLARRAIAVLAADRPGRSDSVTLRLKQLCDAFLSAEEEQRHEMLMRLRQDGVTTDEIIDHVVPATAAMMGERWFADEISFAHVTIGAARLQEAVRALGWRDPSQVHGLVSAPSILIVIPRGEDHTLGAFVLADQLRRRGYQVDMAIDRFPRQIAEMLRKRRYCMVGITVSGRRTLASAKELVDIIRLTVTRVTPVIIGGAILDKGYDTLTLTGADHTARDASAALRRCGLDAVVQGAAPQELENAAGMRLDRL